MARYWRVSPKFWSDPKVLAWTEDGRLLALYVLTCPHRTAEGLFRLPRSYILADLGWQPRRLTPALGELTESEFVAYDEQAQVCLILKAMAYESPQNENQAKAAVRKLAEVPPTVLASEFKRLVERFSERLAKVLPEGFGNPLSLTPARTPALAPTATASPGEPTNGLVASVKPRAQAITVDYWERTDPKPVTAFPALRERVEECLVAGWSDAEVRAALPKARAFTREALQFTLTEASRGPHSVGDDNVLRAMEDRRD